MAYVEDSFTVTSTQHKQPFTAEAIGFVPGNVFVTVESQNVRFRYGPRIPTAGEGHLIYSGGEKLFDQSMDIQNLKFIATTGTATVVFTVKGR